MSTRAAEELLDRIMMVDWKYNLDHEGSHAMLLQEHFRRMVVNTTKFDRSRIFQTGDLANLVNPKASAPYAMVKQLKAHLLGKTWPAFIRTLEYALHWSVARYTEPAEVLHGLPDPYKPIIKMYERGGTFTYDHKKEAYLLSMDNLGAMVTKQPNWYYWDRRQPFVRLDENALAEADIEWLEMLDDQ